jgi:hypothetical protein
MGDLVGVAAVDEPLLLQRPAAHRCAVE